MNGLQPPDYLMNNTSSGGAASSNGNNTNPNIPMNNNNTNSNMNNNTNNNMVNTTNNNTINNTTTNDPNNYSIEDYMAFCGVNTSDTTSAVNAMSQQQQIEYQAMLKEIKELKEQKNNNMKTNIRLIAPKINAEGDYLIWRWKLQNIITTQLKVSKEKWESLVADDTKSFEDIGPNESQRQWYANLSISTIEQLGGAAAQFCSNEGVSTTLEVFRVLSREYEKTSRLKESQEYDNLRKSRFTIDKSSKESPATQLAMWASANNALSGRLPSLIPTPTIRNHLLLDRLLQGLPQSFNSICGELRILSSTNTDMTWRHCLKRLQDHITIQSNENKNETQIFYCNKERENLKREIREEIRKENGGNSYYNNSGGKGKGKGGKGKGKNNNWKSNNWKNNSWKGNNNKGGNNKGGKGKGVKKGNNNTKGGKNNYNNYQRTQCSNCQRFGHLSTNCWDLVGYPNRTNYTDGNGDANADDTAGNNGNNSNIDLENQNGDDNNNDVIYG